MIFCIFLIVIKKTQTNDELMTTKQKGDFCVSEARHSWHSLWCYAWLYARKVMEVQLRMKKAREHEREGEITHIGTPAQRGHFHIFSFRKLQKNGRTQLLQFWQRKGVGGGALYAVQRCDLKHTGTFTLEAYSRLWNCQSLFFVQFFCSYLAHTPIQSCSG